MNDCGISETNNPRVRVLWEREGKTVTLHLAVEPVPAPQIATTLPPTPRQD
ncbi:hypothetical protein GCM10010221_46220 [Streptomyces parvus]|uniref:hypothetical protein n=1 Tax=Streptomyces parvus TaxID=66428 RepID=UPI00142EF7B7|nr:hypothetical protein [Streptomyces parvus]GGS42073.1 hypothetical protein GCM10010221_46220 [Streptomyces parvus]